MAYFLCTLAHGTGWDKTRGIREQDGWDEHAAFMDGLVAEGTIVVGGPVGVGSWAADGHLVVDVLEPWALWLDGRAPKTRPPEQDG